jgi:hypothetical protein
MKQCDRADEIHGDERDLHRVRAARLEESDEPPSGEIKWRKIQDYFRCTWHKPAPFGAPPP